MILTIGMGVDSNVLIFERIREEMHAGKSPAAAVDQGFAHAWTTIVDTHVTTIVSAAILFLFGTGPVQGFAVTLTFGLSGQPVYRSLCFASHLRFDPEAQAARGGTFHWLTRTEKLQLRTGPQSRFRFVGRGAFSGCHLIENKVIKTGAKLMAIAAARGWSRSKDGASEWNCFAN